jgi:hypothetical protein
VNCHGIMMLKALSGGHASRHMRFISWVPVGATNRVDQLMSLLCCVMCAVRQTLSLTTVGNRVQSLCTE